MEKLLAVHIFFTRITSATEERTFVCVCGLWLSEMSEARGRNVFQRQVSHIHMNDCLIFFFLNVPASKFSNL